MSEKTRVSAIQRPRAGTAILFSVLVAIVMALGVAASTTMASAPCPAGNVCAYNQFGENRTAILCIGGYHPTGIVAYEAKNSCANKKAELYWQEGEVIRLKACMNPGGYRPEPGRFNVINVGAEGSRC